VVVGNGKRFALVAREVTMNYRMQLSPISGTRQMVADVHRSEASDSRPANLDDAKFVRSWLVYDSDLDLNRTRGRMNWNMVLGVALAAVVSAGVWIGAGLILERLWK
jgi:hypothetical protein